MNALEVRALRAELAELSRKALEVAEHPTLPNQEKLKLLAPYERKIAIARKQVDDFDYAEKQRVRLVMATESPYGDVLGATEGDWFPGQAIVGAAPTLHLSTNEMKTLREAASERRSTAVIATKVAGPVTDGGIGPSTYPQQLLPPVPIAREPQRVFNLIPTQAATGGGMIEWYSSSGTSSAAATAEGATKPLSDIAYAKHDSPIIKVAHRLNVSLEVIEDFPAFSQLVQADMIHGLIDAESDEILNGSGTAPHMLGLLNASGIMTTTRAGEDPLSTVEHGITALRSSGRFVEPTALVMAPGTFSALRTERDANGRYLAGNPLETGPTTLWGIPCVLTSKMPAEKILAADFEEATRGWVKGGVRVMTNTDSDDFAKNMVTIICEERFLVVPVAPSALNLIDIT